jgi:uncharacterized protein (DUF362 family)
MTPEPDAKSREQTEPRRPISRREFLWQAGATGAAILATAAVGVELWRPGHRVPGCEEVFEEVKGLTLADYGAAAGGAPALAIAHGSQRGPTVRAAIEALGGMGRFIKKGDIVLIKPNVAFDRPPALGVTTHPETLRALARMIREAGAAQIRVADNPINHPEGCFLKTGLAEVAGELDLRIVYPEPAAFAPLAMKGRLLDQWPIFFAPLRGVTKVIGVAPCKDHNLAGASLTMKNWYGLLGGPRNQLHQRIDEAVACFARMIRPTLVVLDAMTVLAANGPTGGRLSDLKTMDTIVAGTDMVAVDACGNERLLGRTKAPGYLDLAHRQGLGNQNWRALNPREVRT